MMNRYKILLFFLLIPGYLMGNQANSSDSLLRFVKNLQYNYPDSAINILEKAIINHSVTNDVNFADFNYHLAYIYYIKGNYPKSQSKYILAYQLYDSLEEQKGKAKALNGRGLIYLGRELYREALQIFDKAVTINKAIKNENSLCSNYLNMGICYYKIEDSKKAFQMLHRALSLATINEFEVLHTMTLNHLGYAHLASGYLDSSHHYFRKVYINNEASEWEKSFSLAGLAQVQFAKKNYPQAIEYGKEGMKIAEQLNAKWDLTQLAKVLSSSYEKDNQFKKALQYANLHKIYSDSILNEAKNRELNWVELQQTKLENEKLSGEKELIAAKAKLYKYSNVIMTVLLLFLMLIILFFRKYSRQKSKYYGHLNDLNKQIIHHKNKIEEQNLGLSELNSSKNRLFSILAHDLRSPMMSIQQVLELNKQEKLSETEFRDFMMILEKQVANVNFMLNDLLSWANTQMDGMQIQPISFDLAEIVEQNITTFEFVSGEKDISIEHRKTGEIEIYADTEHSKIIINNLLNNAIKFTPPKGTIKIFYTEHPEKWSINIQDSGFGMDNSTKMLLLSKNVNRSYSRSGTKEEMGTGLGMLLVKQFANYNNAVLDIESEENKGTTISVSFPKSKPLQLNRTA